MTHAVAAGLTTEIEWKSLQKMTLHELDERPILEVAHRIPDRARHRKAKESANVVTKMIGRIDEPVPDRAMG